MRDSWLELLDHVLRPARPHRDRERCLREQERHLAQRRVVTETRARALARCMADIESARAAVFAAEDGFVPSRMTDLEREWRKLSRNDPEAGMMDLWARIAPASWMDQKRWRDADPAAQLAAAVALAADVEGVEAAESAVASLHVAAAACGARIGSRTLWRCGGAELDFDQSGGLLAEPLRLAREALAAGARQPGKEAIVAERAARLERDVLDVASVRFVERPLLAAGIAHAAFVDEVCRGTPRAALPDLVTPLRALWKTGYVICAIDATAVTLAVTPLSAATSS